MLYPPTPIAAEKKLFYNACCMWDNSGYYLGIHYICIMLCTVKVEQLRLQSILVELNLATLFSAVSLNFFNETTLIPHAGASISVTVYDAFKVCLNNRQTSSNYEKV